MARPQPSRAPPNDRSLPSWQTFWEEPINGRRGQPLKIETKCWRDPSRGLAPERTGSVSEKPERRHSHETELVSLSLWAKDCGDSFRGAQTGRSSVSHTSRRATAAQTLYIDFKNRRPRLPGRQFSRRGGSLSPKANTQTPFWSHETMFFESDI